MWHVLPKQIIHLHRYAKDENFWTDINHRNSGNNTVAPVVRNLVTKYARSGAKELMMGI